MMRCILSRGQIKVLKIVTTVYLTMETKTMTRNLIAEYSNLTSLQTCKTITNTMILSLLTASKFHNFKQVKTEVQRMKAKA